ncbi:FAD-dependent 2-octaprenylphenol hydroxylase [Vibrio sp. UCD-FRSSP16_10]|uniref:FAD-dependent 2-octaprenylphenol hydroxylase n=1 Tax=unclassified Vibrio TaxID=2614977 RepID=UPI0007FEEE1E|nr:MULTISPECIES: FAD-dependent 2-octaprenylphenol hydroxylase [unclassified Vibrio]OBT17353.1 FAD-dependent 2-octaprenylphenol hydroxylase [Vibrio sp. UCD-FRSSP16_30]OBT23122.1 FAD-dependent 2-octaprenylphenol hydroxylase [Vibrio sp. UCD-FRSSP16_10]
MIKNVDLAIVGGGMVGLTLALALKDTDIRIAIIESAEPIEVSDEPASRVSALSRASEAILCNLGAWLGIAKQRHTPYTKMQVWEKDTFAKIDFSASDLHEDNLGHIVENQIIQSALLEQVAKLENVTLFQPNKCSNLAIGEREAWLTLDNGQNITAKLVVAADGANSWVRQQQGFPVTEWDYDHSAIVANVTMEEPHQGVARQVFTHSGPLAFLPLHEPNLCSIVWSQDTDRAQQLMSAPNESFIKQLTVDFDMRLGNVQNLGNRTAIPLRMRYARDFAKERVALIGDAAHTIHPLAGQGVNLGLLDAVTLAQEVEKHWNLGKDIGEYANLRHFERWRKAEAIKMISSMQGFKELFEGDDPLKKLIRGVGMSLAGTLPGVKNEVMRHALGLKGDLPKLAK